MAQLVYQHTGEGDIIAISQMNRAPAIKKSMTRLPMERLRRSRARTPSDMITMEFG
jgi:hypothetical protein